MSMRCFVCEACCPLAKQFLEAWNLVLSAPFTSLLPPVSKDKEEKCRDTLRLGEKKLGKQSLSRYRSALVTVMFWNVGNRVTT